MPKTARVRIRPTTKNADANEEVGVYITLPAFAHKALKEESARRSMTMGQIVLEALMNRTWVRVDGGGIRLRDSSD